MREHVDAQVPFEACGLVAGQLGRSRAVFHIENVLHSPVRFRMEPAQQVQALIQIDENQWDLLAIYHSHPNGPAAPSVTDLNETTFPDTIALIWSPRELDWICRGFILQEGEFNELPVQVIDR